MGVQMSIFDLVSSFGRTSPEHLPQTEGKILEPSWKNFVESKKTTFQFLCLTAEDGRIAERSSATASLLRGDLWTLNTSEYLNVASVSPSWSITGEATQRTYYFRESRLSEILQTDASEKYYLSAKACEGILRRADKRGKELPEVLKKALTNQITRTPSKFGGGSETYLKSDGRIGTAGKGALIQTEQSATLGVSQDQTLFTPKDRQQIEEFVDAVNAEAKHQQDLIQSDLGVARTIAPGTHGAGSHLTKTLCVSKAYGLGRDSFNSGSNAQFTMSIEEETQPPITERGAGGYAQ